MQTDEEAVDEAINDLMRADDQSQIVSMQEGGAIGAITRSEVEAQISAAHRYPRSDGRFVEQAVTLATKTRKIAESCMYTVPRGGKQITGPSVRLAEICASRYGNLQVGARVVDATDTHVIAQGIAWDMQTNLRCTIEVQRRITDRYGKRYNDDMITVTGAAACSIALRNAIFRVIPKSLVSLIYDKARHTAVGNQKTLPDRRDDIISRLNKIGVSTERILARLEKETIEDVGLTEIETLIGLGTAIHEDNTTIEEAFPPLTPSPAPPEKDGKRISLGKGKAKDGGKEPKPDKPAKRPTLKEAIRSLSDGKTEDEITAAFEDAMQHEWSADEFDEIEKARDQMLATLA